MDDTHNYSLAQMNGPFKGVLTRLLAEAFYMEGEYEPLPEVSKKQKNAEKKLFLRQFAKPFQ